MKFLILHSFAHKHPLYLLPYFIQVFSGKGERLQKWIPSIGKVKDFLFTPDYYDGIEFDVEHTGVFNKNTWEFNLPRLRRFENQKLYCGSVHGVFPLGSSVRLDKVGPTLNLAYPIAKVVDGTRAHIRLTSMLVTDEFPLLVLHPGKVPIDMPQEQMINNVITNLQACLKDLEKTKVIICLENLATLDPRTKFKVVSSDYYVLKEIVAKLNHPQIKIVYDWGHANISARFYYESHKNHLPQDFLSSFQYHKDLVSELASDIVYLHLNYNSAHRLDFVLPRATRGYGWDFHAGFNTLDFASAHNYKEILFDVYLKSGLRQFGGKVLLEINPQGPAFIGMSYMGATDQEAIQTVKTLRQWFNDFEVRLKNSSPKKI